MRFGTTRYGVIVLLLLALIGLFGVSCLYRSDTGAGNIRNVLLISIDTCRADHLSCYGYESKTTPNIDALAAEGILFENVIAPIPQTLPSHASMLTGTVPPYHGVHDNTGYQFHESNTSLAEILKDAGFATGAVISSFPLDSEFGIDQGFDSYHDRFETPLERNVIDQRQGGETTDLAIHWVEKNKDERFFLFLHYFDPHYRYQPPDPFAARFADNPYAGEIAYTDHCIGKILDKLKEVGLYDSTLIIVTSDHGEMLGEHGEPTHAYFIYQSAIKVPLIFKVPGWSKEVRIKSIAGLIDIVPTVCGLLNIQTRQNVQGIDLSASFEGENISARERYLFCESFFGTKYKANSLLGILNERYKYIQTTRPELYDLVKDPGESDNLVEKQKRQARIMKDSLAQVLKKSVRNSFPNSKMDMDFQAMQRLKSLGYVGGLVSEDFSFDQTKDDPKDLLAYHVLSIQIHSYFEAKEYDQVEKLAEQMIRERPDCSFAYETLGMMALEQKEYSKAIVCFQNAIDHGSANTDRATNFYNLGVVYQAKGDYDRAIGNFDQAIELNPRDAKSHGSRGVVYMTKGVYELAIRDFRKAIDFKPNSKMLNNLAWPLATANDPKLRDGAEALRLAAKACKLTNYKDPSILDTLAAAYSETGQFAQAVKNAQKAIEIAQATGDKKLAENIQRRLELYKANRPCHELFAP